MQQIRIKIPVKNILEKLINGKLKAFLFTPPTRFIKNSSIALNNDFLLSHIFYEPYYSLSTDIKNDSDEIDNKVKEEIEKGGTALTLLNYEAGYKFEKKLNHFSEKKTLTVHFFNKNNIHSYNYNELSFDEFPGILYTSEYSFENILENITYSEYKKGFEKIKNEIAKGNVYQVNYTFKISAEFKGDLLQLFTGLIFNQSASYTAFINEGNNIVVSFSPELFFKLNKNELISKPMKGTSQKGLNYIEMINNSEKMHNDTKSIAENVMIVDLMRNDLVKVSEPGTVVADENYLFSVEIYETLLQMTSLISGKPVGLSFIEIIKKIFPSGSVTGAPKISAMEIIKRIEKEKRGIYTGAIGFINQNIAIFNVAIRTFLLDKENLSINLGVGSGVVWDSKPNLEWKESKLKANFLLNPVKYFEIFETIRVEFTTAFYLEEHYRRMRNAAEFFSFSIPSFDDFINYLNTIIEKQTLEEYAIKIFLNKWGDFSYLVREIQPFKSRSVIISLFQIDSYNPFQYFKTTNRRLYDLEYENYKHNTFADVIFFNEKGYLAEGITTNIILKIRNIFYTPSINSGILNGIHREIFLNSYNLTEDLISMNDLLQSTQMYICNSVKGDLKIKDVWKTTVDDWISTIKEYDE